MMFVLDTNVVSELRKVRLGKADTNVTEQVFYNRKVEFDRQPTSGGVGG